MEKECSHPRNKRWGNQFIKSAIIVLFLIVFVAAPADAFAKDPEAAKSETKPEQKANSVALGLKAAMKKAGVTSCADRVNQVTDFLTSNNESGAITFPPPSEPDRRLLSFSLGLKTPDGKVAYASESFAPNQANGCGGMYETVVYWESACADVAKRQFSTFKSHGLLVNNITVLNGGTGVRVFLMPAGTGCVAIKKEVLN
jgi:hypothetical protein